MNDSGHDWFAKEDFNKAMSDLRASRAKVKELEVSVSQLKVAIRATQSDKPCSHQMNTTYNGQAVWCKNCESIWLTEDIANKMKEAP